MSASRARATVPVLESRIETVKALTDIAHRDLTETLTRYGNKLDPRTLGGARHRKALHAVLHTYSELAITGKKGRIAFPLAVGVGKTQSIASWIAVVHKLGLPLSVLVCQEKIDSLEELYGDLIGKGVPAEKIGLLHSKPCDPKRAEKDSDYASIPSCGIETVQSRQFALVTHAKIKTQNDAVTLNSWGIEERSLCIWDESLLKNEGRYVLASEIEDGISSAVNKIKGHFAIEEAKQNQAAKEALNYIEASIRHLANVIQEDAGGEDRKPTRLQPRDADTLEKYETALKEVMSGYRTSRALLGQLKSFLEISQEPIRMVSLGTGKSGDGAITYLPKVPDALQRIVILDASYLVRELERADEDITLVPDYEHVKRFDAVEVTQVREYGGRHSVEKLRRNSRVTKMVVQDILDSPKNEATLIITYKTKGRRGPTETIQDALEDAGVNLSETIYVKVWSVEQYCYQFVEKPRFQFIHWGMEKAVSKFAYCQNMLAVGVMRRDTLDLSSAILAQTDDHSSKLATDREYIEKVSASEQFYRLQQYIGRGSAREIVNGDSKPAKVKVYDQTDFTPFLEHGLPGVNWTCKGTLRAHEGKRRGPKGTQTKHLAEKIAGFLREYPGESLSVRDLKEQLGMKGLPRASFRLARDKALGASPEWSLEGRTLSRS